MSYQPTILITGANSGLGLATATLLLSRSSPSYHVIITCRTSSVASTTSKHLSSLPTTKGKVSTVTMDVTDDASVDAAAAELRSRIGHLDVLVNNAGVYGGFKGDDGKPASLRDGLRDALGVNTVGSASVTDGMKGLLLSARPSSDDGDGHDRHDRDDGKVSKVIFVSTALASLTYSSDPTSHHHGPYATAYRASKAAMNMLVVQYANDPTWTTSEWTSKKGTTTATAGAGAGVKVEVIGIDPGFLATDLSGNRDLVRKMGAIEPEEGAEVVVRAITGEVGFEKGRVTGASGVNAW